MGLELEDAVGRRTLSDVGSRYLPKVHALYPSVQCPNASVAETCLPNFPLCTFSYPFCRTFSVSDTRLPGALLSLVSSSCERTQSKVPSPISMHTFQISLPTLSTPLVAAPTPPFSISGSSTRTITTVTCISSGPPSSWLTQPRSPYSWSPPRWRWWWG